MNNQQVIINFTMKDDGDVGINMTFEPTLVGDLTDEWGNLSEEDKILQDYRAKVASFILAKLEQYSTSAAEFNYEDEEDSDEFEFDFEGIPYDEDECNY